MPIRGRQKIIGKALAGSMLALVCAYLWMRGRKPEAKGEEQREYGTVAVVVTAEVVANAATMQRIKDARDREKDVVLVVHPEVGSLGLERNHSVLRVSQEASIYHILKQIGPHVTLVPAQLYECAVEEHRLNRFLPNVLVLEAGMVEEYVAHASHCTRSTAAI